MHRRVGQGEKKKGDLLAVAEQVVLVLADLERRAAVLRPEYDR